MCGRFLLYPLFFALLLRAPAALRAQERLAGPWYLISEQELRIIEAYLAESEREKRSWLLQAQSLAARAERLERLSETLNGQLAFQLNATRALEKSFSEYERENATAISLRDGESAALRQALAGKALEAERYKGLAALRLAVIIALGAAAAGYVVLRVLRFRIRPA